MRPRARPQGTAGPGDTRGEAWRGCEDMYEGYGGSADCAASPVTPPGPGGAVAPRGTTGAGQPSHLCPGLTGPWGLDGGAGLAPGAWADPMGPVLGN